MPGRTASFFSASTLISSWISLHICNIRVQCYTSTT